MTVLSENFSSPSVCQVSKTEPYHSISAREDLAKVTAQDHQGLAQVSTSPSSVGLASGRARRDLPGQTGRHVPEGERDALPAVDGAGRWRSTTRATPPLRGWRVWRSSHSASLTPPGPDCIVTRPEPMRPQRPTPGAARGRRKT